MTGDTGSCRYAFFDSDLWATVIISFFVAASSLVGFLKKKISKWSNLLDIILDFSDCITRILGLQFSQNLRY